MIRTLLSTRTFSNDRIDPLSKAGLIGHWVSGEGAGLSWRDRTGYQNHGVFSAGSPKWSIGGPQGDRPCVKLAAGSDLINCGSPAIFDDLLAFTLCAYVCPAALTDEQQIIAKITPTFTAGWVWVIDTTGTITFFRANNGTSPTLTSDVTVPIGRWTHVAVTMPIITGVGTAFYFAGQKVGISVSSTGGTLKTDVAANLTLGSREGDALGLVGILDDVRIYDRVLSSAMIARIARPDYQVTTPSNLFASTVLVSNPSPLPHNQPRIYQRKRTI